MPTTGLLIVWIIQAALLFIEFATAQLIELATAQPKSAPPQPPPQPQEQSTQAATDTSAVAPSM